MIKGVAFDIDGILVETEYLQWQGWVEVLKPYGISLSREQYFKYAGKRGDIIESELIRDFNMELKPGALLEPKERLVRQWVREKELRLMPYAREAVEFFAERGIALVASGGAPREEGMLKLERTGLVSLFPIIVTGSDVERGKPNPDMYILAAERLGLMPEECLAFEDTEYGLESAKRAGFISIAVPNEYSVKQDFSRADSKFNDLKEAMDWVRKKYF